MTSQHSADAAGGEAVYSSDALPPLPVPPAPKQKITSFGSAKDDTLDSEFISTTEAFQNFSSNASNANSMRLAVEKGETRMQKLERIRRELDELENAGKSVSGSGDDGNDDDITNTRESGALVNELQERLNQMMDINVISRQKELTRILTNAGVAAEVVPTATVRATETVSTSVMEQRLLRIENLLGGSGLGGVGDGQIATSSSVLERLKLAEGQLKSVNEKTLNQAASRAKVIRADLEAAAKARSKLNTNAQDTNKIAKLYNQMMELDGFLSGPGSSSFSSGKDVSGAGASSSPNSTILSVIVNRLSTCAELHSKSMHFGKDLDALEHMVGDVQALMGSLEETVGNLEAGMTNNMKIIQANMEDLDKRLS